MKSLRIADGDLAWSFAALLLQFGTSLLVLPALLHFLSAEQIGLWYAYQLVGGLALLLEFGYQSTFARNISYVAAGATALRHEGIPTVKRDHDETLNHSLMSALLCVMKRKYLEISVIMFATLITVGTGYIAFVGREHSSNELYTTWFIYLLVTVISFYLGRFVNILTGLNKIRLSQQLQIVARLLSVAVIIALLWGGAGLAGAVIGYGLGALMAPALAFYALQRIPAYVHSVSVQGTAGHAELGPILWHNARKSGEVAVGTFIVQRAASLIASTFLTLQEFASFSLTLQIIQMVAGLARVKIQISIPALVTFAGRSNLQEFRKLFMSAMTMSWSIYLVGVAGVLAVGGDVVQLLGSSVPLLNTVAIVLLALLYLLEITHGNCAWGLTCFNTVPFARATWATGAAISISGLLVAAFTNWGVTGFVAAQLFCQLMYNAWKWPMELSLKCEWSITSWKPR